MVTMARGGAPRPGSIPGRACANRRSTHARDDDDDDDDDDAADDDDDDDAAADDDDDAATAADDDDDDALTRGGSRSRVRFPAGSSPRARASERAGGRAGGRSFARARARARPTDRPSYSHPARNVRQFRASEAITVSSCQLPL